MRRRFRRPAGARKSTDGASWPFGGLKLDQAAAFEGVLLSDGTAASYLRIEGRDWWIPWHRLVERWLMWAAGSARAKPGTASLSTADCAELGTEVSGCDWRRVLTGESVDSCPF